MEIKDLIKKYNDRISDIVKKDRKHELMGDFSQSGVELFTLRCVVDDLLIVEKDL